jgi:hypothetical protein
VDRRKAAYGPGVKGRDWQWLECELIYPFEQILRSPQFAERAFDCRLPNAHRAN